MQQQQFSSVTKTYLCRFYEILDEMIDGRWHDQCQVDRQPFP